MDRPATRQINWRWQERIGVADKKTLDGDQSVYFNRLMDLGDPVEDGDAATKKYVDDAFGDGEIIVVIGTVEDIADLDIDYGSGGSDADAVMAVHLAMYDHTNADKLNGLADTAFLKHDLATAANDFLVSLAAGTFVKKTLTETQTILGCRWSLNEIPAGAIDGINVTFTLDHTPVDQIMLYLNGQYLAPGAGEDYTLSGLTITMAAPLVPGDRIRTNYPY